jgi:hypothetical protein
MAKVVIKNGKEKGKNAYLNGKNMSARRQQE